MFTAPRIAAALATAAVVGCGTIAAETGSTDAPVACSLERTQSGRGLLLEGVVEARTAVSGDYRLTVSGPGTSLNQGGPFRLSAGETATLGRVTLGGSSAAGDATLTLDIAGRSYRCPET